MAEDTKEVSVEEPRELTAEEKLRSEMDERGGFVGSSVSELEEKVKELKEQKDMDGLTGLLLRNPWYETGARFFEHSLRRKENLSVLYLDINDFKAVNDEKGHMIGDMAIVEVAESVKRAIRRADFGGRVGGDEMAICLPGADITQAKVVADRIKKNLEKNSRENPDLVKNSVTPTVTIGIATIAEGKTFTEVVNAADAHMRQLKELEGHGR